MRPFVKILQKLLLGRIAVEYSVVCQSVCHIVSPAKTAEPIEMPFALRTRMGPGIHVLDGDSDPHGKGQF